MVVITGSCVKVLDGSYALPGSSGVRAKPGDLTVISVRSLNRSAHGEGVLEDSSDAGAAYIRAAKMPPIIRPLALFQDISPDRSAQLALCSALTCRLTLSSSGAQSRPSAFSGFLRPALRHARRPARISTSELLERGVPERTACSAQAARFQVTAERACLAQTPR